MIQSSGELARGKGAKKLGDLLLEDNIITQQQLQDAIAEQRKNNGFLGQILVEKGFIDQVKLTQYLVKQSKAPHLSLQDYEIADQVGRIIPEDVCLRLQILPIDKLGRILTVAMVNPLDIDALQEVQSLCPTLRIKPILCSFSDFQNIVDRCFGAGKKDLLDADLYKDFNIDSPFKPKSGGDAVKESEKESPPAPGQSTQEYTVLPATELAETLAVVMREGMRESIAELGSVLAAKGHGPESGTAAQGVSAEALDAFAARLEQAFSGSMTAMSGELRGFAEELRAEMSARRDTPGGAQGATTSAPDFTGLAESLRSTLAEAVREAVSPLAARLSAAPAQPGDSAAAPATDPREIALAVQEGVSQVMSGSLSSLAGELRALAEAQQTRDAALPGPGDIAKVMQETLSETLNTAMASLAGELRTMAEARRAETAALPTPDDIKDAMRESVSSSMREALDPIGRDIREAVAASRQPAPEPEKTDWNQVAFTIQEGVAGAIEHSIADMVVQLKSSFAQKDSREAAEQQQASAMIAEQIRGAITESSAGQQQALAALAEQLRQSLGETQDKTAALLAGQIHEALTASAGGQREAAAEIAEKLSQALNETQNKTAALLAGQIREILTASAGGQQQAMAEIAGQIRDSLGETQQQTAALLAERLREAIAESMAGVRDAQHSGQTELAKAAQAALQTIAEENRASREAQLAELSRMAALTLESISGAKQSQESQQAQLAQIAESAMLSVRQTTQLIESHLVAENNRRDLMRRRRNRYASVAPFGGAPGEPPQPEELTEEDGRLLDALDSETPLESLTFDNFFPGTVNEFTFKVSKAVAAAPGGEYNPFFLYGNVGIGKTHLISAIGNAILAGSGKKKGAAPARIGYVSASHFARRMADAMAEGALDAFRTNYCHWDVLILDDIQFLGGRVEAQEEFFHIFNALHQQNRQVIIAADKAPDRLGLLEQRLVSRFASGIVAELKAPEWETRMQILRHRAKESGVEVREEILGLIAMKVTGDVRKMAGALRKVLAFAKLVGKDISVEMAQEILNHLGADEAA